MIKTYRRIAALALAAASSQALALGLGTIVVKSQLDEPLLAEIPVISASPDEASGLQARVAAPNEMERAGVDSSHGSAPVELQVVETKDGRTVIRVTTRAAVHDPIMAFLVNVSWPSGRLLREYKVTFSGRSSGAASTVTQAAPEPERAAAAAAPPPPKPKAAPAEAKPTVAARPSEPPAPKPAAVETKPQPAKAAPAPVPVPPKPVAAESKATTPATPPAKPVAAEVKSAPAPAKAPPPPAPPAKPPAETKATATPPKAEAPPATQAAAAAKPVAPAPASTTASSAPTDAHAELERAKAELAAKEAESKALRGRLAELEKSQPANRERLEQENKKLEDAERQLNETAKHVDAQQQAVAQTPASGAAPPPAAPVPAGSGDSGSDSAGSPTSASSAAATEPQGADGGTAPQAAAPAGEPTPPPTPEFRWYDDWMMPGGIGVALLMVAALALVRMRRGKVATAPVFAVEPAVEPEFDLSEPEPGFGDGAAEANEFVAVAPDAADTEEQFNMLRLFYLRGDATGFEQAARHIYEQDPDPDLWRRVTEMGRMVSPDDPLFADASGGIKRMEFDLPELSTPVPAEAMVDAQSPAHDLIFESEHPTPPPPVPEVSTGVTEYEAVPVEPVEAVAPSPDPWADDSATVATPAPVSASYEPEAPAADLQIDAVAGDEDHAAPTPPSPPPATHAASRPATSADDPVDTKLELALAYLEMGDADAARHMLDEVMDEGDSRQKAEALKLRDEAGGGQRRA